VRTAQRWSRSSNVARRLNPAAAMIPLVDLSVRVPASAA